MGRRRREGLDKDEGKLLRWILIVRKMKEEGLPASVAFKTLCEYGVSFDVAFEIVRDEYGVLLDDLLRWSEEEGWMEEGGWFRKIEEGMGIIIEGRLVRRALEGSVAAQKAYLVKWRPEEWSERVKVESVGEPETKVMVVLGYVPKDMEQKVLPPVVEVVDISKQVLEAGEEGEGDREGSDA